MKFGQIPNPETIDFTLPKDALGTKDLLIKNSYTKEKLEIYVGCAKWNKADLKGFYPKGIKNELEYYSRQFNSIELNATFYRLFPAWQFEKWKEAVPDGFKFFPKLGQDISHWARLKDVEQQVDEYLYNISHLGDRLGVPFLQMHNNFGPKDRDRVVTFVEHWPQDAPLAIEFRHTDWYNNPAVSKELYELLEKHQISNIIVDTAGRRDLLHMRLTTPAAFVRYVGANHKSDYARLDSWIDRIEEWQKNGLQRLYFFVHQNIEVESPLLSAYFIQKLNDRLGFDLSVPMTQTQHELF